MKKIILLLALLILFSPLNYLLAQEINLSDPGILPDSPFYFLKSFFEGVGNFFTFNNLSKAERFLNLSETRLAEADALIDKGKIGLAQRSLERHQEQLNLSLFKAEEARQKGLNADQVLARVSEATLRHQAFLIEVYEKVPEEAKPAIERAMEAGMLGHEQALQAVSEENRQEIIERIGQKKEEAKRRLEELRGKRDLLFDGDVPELPEEAELPELPELPEEAELPELPEL